MKFNSISVIGLGYIGLPTAALIASQKVNVIGIDINEDIVNDINKGKAHFTEPGLDEMVKKAVASGYLKASTTPKTSDAYLITVPTPLDEKTKKPDISYISAACQSISTVLKAGDLIVLESTSPVGTTDKVCEWLQNLCPHLSFPHSAGEESNIRIAYCPERVLPGQILSELIQNNRIIGGYTDECIKLAISLYEIIVRGECVATTPKLAEMTKLVENSFRDVNIAFANELSKICDELELNVWSLIKLANLHPRVNVLNPGPGVGGHCIAVDPWFIVDSCPEEAKIIKTAREINDQKPKWIIEKIKLLISEFLSENPSYSSQDITIGFYGLTFKANIDDLRESPAVKITHSIANFHPGKILVAEPNIRILPKELRKLVELTSVEIVNSEAMIKILLVDHKEFLIDPKYFLSKKVKFLDTRGFWNV